jgi:hypothetical protein
VGASQETNLGLEELFSKIARHYCQTASRPMMSQDSLLGSLYWVETLMLQSRYLGSNYEIWGSF